ncbi:Amine GPCR [Fasciola gigantica]|uniref:Amine GPCR n=1 Tax=Fasciola gigantica TaxID=46835 RepID=A0A504YUJ4_FASGI|nr:Amine GPCR [Fasciola gigantica]
MPEVQSSPAFLAIAGSLDCFGILSNVLMLCYLFCNRVGSKLTTDLMKNQLAFDGLTSVFALCSLFVPDDLFTSLDSLGGLFCRLWVSRTIFWFLVLLSETNLVCIAVDRIRAVAFSSTYKQRGKITLTFYYSFIFSYSVIFAIPFVFTVKYDGSQCQHLMASVSNSSSNIYSTVQAYLWLFTGYLIPGLVMTGCYIHIVVLMRKFILKKLGNLRKSPTLSQNNSYVSTSVPSTLSSFSRSFIVTAITMWSAFLITHAYYTIYTILCTHGAVKFMSDSVQRRVGIFATVINSTLNPLIMVVSSPPFRRGLWKFLRSCHGTTTVANASDASSIKRDSQNCIPPANRNDSPATAQ